MKARCDSGSSVADSKRRSVVRSGALWAVLGACLLGACSLVPPAADSDRVAELPADYSEGSVPGGHQPLEWWRAFEDPALDQVVEAVLESSFDLAQAVARVEQARARARIARASRLPTLQAGLGVNEFDAPTNTGLGAQLDDLGIGADVYESFGVELPDRLDLTTYSLSADFAYELDFWGRDRHAALAAGAERLASEADYRAARIGVLAETVATYLEIVDLRCQQHLAGEIVALFREQESLAETRYDRGVIAIRELYAARRALRDAQAGVPQIDARLADAEARLWALLGGYRADLQSVLPQALSPVASLDPVPAGIPADLLVQRPDVSAARQRVEAARHALGARRAELLPSLSLSGSIGLQSAASSEWFDPDQWYRNLSVNLLAPVFQGGRLRAGVALAEAQLDEAAAVFGRAVVTAVNEVEAALAGLHANRQRVSLLNRFVEEAGAEAALQEQRYLAGLGDYAIYLAAAQGLLSAKSALAAGRRELGYARLSLHRALGGAWTADGPVAHGAIETAPDSMPHLLSADTE